MFEPGSSLRKNLMIVSFGAGLFFLLSGWMRVVWPDGVTAKPGVWIEASKKDATDKFGIRRKGVYHAILEPGETLWFYNRQFGGYASTCGQQNPNLVLWEASNGANSVRVNAAVSPKQGGRYTNVSEYDAQRYCGSARYAFYSQTRQSIRVVRMVYDQRTAPAPSTAYSKDLCVQTVKGANCMYPMDTVADLRGNAAASTFKTVRSFLFAFVLLGFCAASYIGFFRVYAVFFPSRAAKRASNQLKRGDPIDVDDLANVPGSDFERRKHNEDLQTLLDEATEKLKELEKKEQELSDAESEDDKLLDELERAIAEVEEIQRKIDAQKQDS